MTPHPDLVDDIRAALTAAADRIDPISAELPVAVRQFTASSEIRTGRRLRSRWLWPAAAAAVVAALAVVTTVVILPRTRDVAAAARITLTGNTADIGGVRFPVPDGWRVAVTSTTGDAVTACVAAHPSNECAGVQLTIAVPDRRGDTEILAGNQRLFDHDCPAGNSSRILMVDDHLSISVAGRPGIHYWGRCGDLPATDHLWQLDDLSLQIYAPPAAAGQGTTVVTGLDLTHWAHHQGPQAAYFTRGSSSPAAPS